MYSNNVVNFQESTTILNAFTKKSGNLSYVPRISPVSSNQVISLPTIVIDSNWYRA